MEFMLYLQMLVILQLSGMILARLKHKVINDMFMREITHVLIVSNNNSSYTSDVTNLVCA